MSNKTLHLKFILIQESEYSPSDFTSFFEFGAGIIREIAILEWKKLIKKQSLQSRYNYDLLFSVEDQIYKQSAPGEILEIKHNSPWEYLVALPVATVGWFLLSCIRPEIKRAWNDSKAREELYEYFKDAIFKGSIPQIMKTSRQSTKLPQGLKVTDVKESNKKGYSLPIITFSLEKKVVEIVTPSDQVVTLSDQELMEEIRKKLDDNS